MQTLPIQAAIPDVLEQLKNQSRLVLMAPPGAGKSTGLPLALLDNDQASHGQIWMLEPRRLAAEQVAQRLAHSLGETLGQSIGLITGERSKTSANNKIIIMTEGVLTQKLILENDIPKCAMVIFDEFHERNLSTDLGLALALQCQEYLREDLKLLIMSATLDVESLCEQLKAPLVKSEGRSYPVESIYRPVSQPQQNSAVARPLESSISQTIKYALQTHDGDILVFLPGIKEIQFVWDQLNALTHECLILPLHGQLHGKDQNRVMTPSSQRKVILATDIAKTSLTLENVTVVIDSGLERITQFNTKTGMDELITVTASQATSIQRAGRAGRVQAGCCYHMFSEEQFNVRPAFTRFAIELEDLAPFTLSLAQWGSLNLDDYFFLDRPDANRYESSQQLLRQLDILHNESLTPHGQSLGRLPLHPRLAHMIYGSKILNLEVSACYMAAILAEGDPLYFEESNSDLNLRLELFSLQHLPTHFAHGKVKKALAKRIQDKAKRLIQLIAAPQDQTIDIRSAGPLTMLAYPDRIAQQRGKGYRLRSGQGCQLFHNDHMKSAEFLAVAHLTRSTTQQSNSSTIRLAAQVSRDDIQKLFQSQYETVCSLDSNNKLHVIEQTKLGAIILNEQRKAASKEDQINHTLQLVKQDGLRSLGLTEPEQNLLAKLQLAHTLWSDIIPDFSEPVLQQEVENWLAPFLNTATELDLSQALLSRVDWNHQNQMKEWLPDQLELPSGRSVKIDYTESQPVVRCKLQECFGLSQSPVIAQGKVAIQLHLLSPAQRPLAQTTDLAFFWKEVYPDVRKENRGRYAKHPWPEDPLTAIASAKTKKHL